MLLASHLPTPFHSLIHRVKPVYERTLHSFFKSIALHLPVLKKLHALEEEIRRLTTYSTDTIYLLRYSSMTYEYFSPAIKQLLGYTPEDLQSHPFKSFILETRLVSNGKKPFGISYSSHKPSKESRNAISWQADYLMKTKDGSSLWVSDTAYPWYDENGRIIGAIGCLRDISERVMIETMAKDELMRLSRIDPLTKLANRKDFFERVDNEFKRTQRSKQNFSILLIDLDHFKQINSAYGNETGDQILIEIATIIKSCLRETDLTARLSGEEFGAVLPDTPSRGALWAAERICQAIAKHPFYIGKHLIHCTASIGIASTNLLEQNSANDLLKDANTRLFIAKTTGRNQVSMDEIYLH